LVTTYVTGTIYYFYEPIDIVIGFFGLLVMAVVGPVVVYFSSRYVRY
jgi:hypothetical protein